MSGYSSPIVTVEFGNVELIESYILQSAINGWYMSILHEWIPIIVAPIKAANTAIPMTI
jgi:hypothetical protein